MVAHEGIGNATAVTARFICAKPDVNGLASLLSWAGLKAESFIRGDSKKKSEALAEIMARLRADPRLSRQNAKLMEDIVVSTYKKLRGV